MRHRLFDAPFGLALMALGTVAWFTLFSVGLVASLQRSELALRRLTETLEHRIAARTSELASARARAEDELQILSSLLENSSDFIGIADPTGKPIYVNRAGRQMVGLAPDYPVGKTRIPEYYPRELRAFAHDVILKTMLERGRWSGETFFRNFQTDEAIPVSDEHFIIRDPSGARLLGFGTVTRNIAAMRRADEELRESEERFRLTFDEAPIGMALVALDGRFVRVNRALCEIVGYSSDELTRLTFHDITHSDDLETDVALAGKLARGEIPRYQLAKRYFRKDGSIVDVMLHGAILRGHDGAPRYYIAQIEDITERKRAEEALRISEESLALAVDASGQGLWDWNIPANEAHLSSRYWTLIGQHEEGRRPGLAFFHSIIHPDDLPAVQRTMQEHLEGKSPGAAVIEYRVRKSSGAEVWLRGIGRVTKRDSQGAPLRMAGVIADITEQKLLEEERARAFKERETLLREIHHRVKNNLQMLSSLFYLQRQRTNQEPLRTLLDESRNRIQSIALIHEKLYQSEHLARIDFGDYLTDLTNAIGAQSPHARIVVRAGEVFLDIDRAIPCALIVNELVSNALKHAFPHGRSGEIRVTVGPDGPGRMRLAVRDDGVGFPAALDFRNTKTLGMQLVCSLTTQLRGTVELVRDGGTCFEIRFLVGAS
jgi:PAS domain S-box-containing protein